MNRRGGRTTKEVESCGEPSGEEVAMRERPGGERSVGFREAGRR